MCMPHEIVEDLQVHCTLCTTGPNELTLWLHGSRAAVEPLRDDEGMVDKLNTRFLSKAHKNIETRGCNIDLSRRSAIAQSKSPNKPSSNPGPFALMVKPSTPVPVPLSSPTVKTSTQSSVPASTTLSCREGKDCSSALAVIKPAVPSKDLH